MFDPEQHIQISQDGKNYKINLIFQGTKRKAEKLQTKLIVGTKLFEHLEHDQNSVIFTNKFYQKVLKELKLCDKLQKNILSKYDEFSNKITLINKEIEGTIEKKKKTKLLRQLEIYRNKKKEIQVLRKCII